MDLGEDKVLVSVVYSVVFIVGLPSNILALWSLYHIAKVNDKPYIYLLNLIAADLIHIVVLPFWIDYVINEHRWQFSNAACKLTGFTFYLNMYTSLFFLSCIALDRYFAIVYPLRFHWLHRKHTMYVISACVWGLALVCNTPGFMYADVDKVSKLCYESYPLNRIYAIYRLFFTSFSFLPPCFIFIFTYVGIHRSLQQSTSLEKTELRRIQRLLFAVILLFVPIFGPYHIAYFYRVIMTLVSSNICQVEQLLYFHFRACCAFVSVNNIFDPLLYIFVSKDVQRNFTRFFKCHLAGQRDTESNEETERSRRRDLSHS
ncbi:G-protein coupled receptor 4-like [Callorhinchus milii]|uniref:G-protein coupled receptor 4-like n=1 Tax=Callorhinchus milii TaxID=7868 RepID=UPI0004572BC8|nr:G-protein coupled receptor 4-like [Callorhinchus milii]|eukprot:gi/632976883/ref/XP_007905037.1/ PREDICTED: G-protein coupled receptor 4-like [Callorhinchus milii]